jgi:tetratricopeptide (TPR) repeat protein
MHGENCMQTRWVVAVAAGSLLLGVGLGIAGSNDAAGIDLIRGKSAKDAAAASLVEAERLAGKGSWEQIGVGRVYYLSGDKARGQAIFDRVTGAKPKASDWQRIGAVYAEAGENDRAEDCYRKVLALNPKDDTGQAEIGAWYIRIGQREKGEALIGQALQRSPNEVWHYVRVAEALLGVPASG